MRESDNGKGVELFQVSQLVIRLIRAPFSFILKQNASKNKLYKLIKGTTFTKDDQSCGENSNGSSWEFSEMSGSSSYVIIIQSIITELF